MFLISASYTFLVPSCRLDLTAHAFPTAQVYSYLARRSTAIGAPTWRYYLNATFDNLLGPLPRPVRGVPHETQNYLVTGNLPANSTPQELALSSYMQGAWAAFVKNPYRGSGWGAPGSDPAGGRDLGVLGTNGGSGVTVVDPRVEVDKRCSLYDEVYAQGHSYEIEA